METVLSSIPTWTAAGGGAGLGFYALKWFVEWLGGRIDKREAMVEANALQNDVATQRLMKQLEERMIALTARLDRVEDELIECRANHAQCEAELNRLKAIMQGYGDARDHAQTIIAAQRLVDREEKK